MNISPTVDDRVGVRFKALAVGYADAGAGAGSDWWPGRVVEVKSFYGQPKYVVALDSGKRVVAHSDEVVTWPCLPWSETAPAKQEQAA